MSIMHTCDTLQAGEHEGKSIKKPPIESVTAPCLREAPAGNSDDFKLI